MSNDPNVSGRPLLLVVDDEEEHCKLLSYILRRDYDVRTASSGQNAIEIASGAPVDLALVDFSMPGMTGIELFARFTQMHHDCIRFLVTAYAEADILQDAINVGNIYRFVQKPVDPEFLRVDIQRALEHRKIGFQLERAAKLAAVGTLASSVVHDLRNCLQVVALVPSLLQLNNPDATQDSIGMLKRTERDMGDLVDELLLLSKGEIPHYDLVRGSLADTVRDTVEMIRHTAPIAERNVELELAADLPPIRIASNRCSRMLTNLMRNAAQATAPGGKINVKVSQTSDKFLVLQVRDNGQGIPAHLKDHVFEPMFTTKGEAGVGLGLSICKAVMAAHGGTLTCESEVGQGTAFLASFPIDP